MPAIANRLIWEQIRQEDDLARKVEMVTDATEMAIEESVQDRCEIRDAIRISREEAHKESVELSKILKGNGEPSKSIIARLERIEENSTKSKANLDKVLWMVVSVVLAELVLTLIRLIGGGI